MKTGSAKQSRPVLGNSVGVKATENNTFCAPVWRLSDLHSGQIIAQSVSDQRSSINRSYSSSSREGVGGRILAQAVYQHLGVQIRLKHNRAAADAPTNPLSLPTPDEEAAISELRVHHLKIQQSHLPAKKTAKAGGERLLHAYVREGARSQQKMREM